MIELIETRAAKPGPKPVDGEPADRAIYIRVTARQRAELAQVAAELDADISSIIRDAVNEFVGDYCERRVFPLSRRAR